MPKVTSLDPRTPHQPVKLQKLSKNDYGFTPSKIWVNRKIEIACALLSIECSWFTGVCSAMCAATHAHFTNKAPMPLFGRLLRSHNPRTAVEI
jgi:hypothetical protein